MSTYKLIYLGTPQFSANILRFISANLSFINLQAVVTQPDKPQGRQGAITPSPVAQTAQKLGIPTFKPQNTNNDNLQHLKLLKPDLFLIVAYGQILPSSWLNAPQIATLNFHFSLLPKYRGALCIKQALLNQDPDTGVTLLEMDQKLDHGPVISQIKQPISTNDDLSTLTQKLKTKANTLLDKTLLPYLQFTQNKDSKTSKINHPDISLFLPPQPQDHSQATHTPPTSQNTHQNAFIPWQKIEKATQSQDASQLHAQIRANSPDPGAWTEIPTTKGDKILKIIKTKLNKQKLTLQKVQLPGKNPISWQQFTTGYQIKPDH